jgi:hypothetical protein
MISLFDKRLKYLKKDAHPLASKALNLYSSNERSYKYYCGSTGSDENDWDEFKNWIINWVLGGQTDDDGLLELYLKWVESDGNLTVTSRKSIESFWYNGGPPAFPKKDDVSGQFWIFAAWAITDFKA